MNIIGLEIHDTGILCAGPEGRLHPTDAEALESPGFALVHGQNLQLGMSALHQARRRPRQVICRFWEELNTQPLLSPEFEGYNHAELAYRHLEQVWRQVSADAAEVVLTVPDHYEDRELGLLLGIASVLGLPIRGLISQALACTPPETDQGTDFHVDLHLHRLVLTAVDGRPRPEVVRHETIIDQGREAVHREWVKMLADAFVHQTRFDPLYAADAEQDLHDRLPQIADARQQDPIHVEMQADGRTHRIQLDQQAFMAPLAPWIENLGHTIGDWQRALSVSPDDSRLVLTHRVAALPGFVDTLENVTGLKARRLSAGAAAANALAYAQLFSKGSTAHGVPYLKRVPRAPADTAAVRAAAPAEDAPDLPTHLLYRGRAYPIVDEPLVVGRELPAGTRGILIQGRLAGVSRHHFSVIREDQQVLLIDSSSYGTLVDEVPVMDRRALMVGQIIRIGKPGETLQAIACLSHHETTIP
ncbi:MAG: FHA domain-containing protein [Desulfobacterales bacterium]|nr:FHA domain-containing protein [Desulfobacterales bacterium]